MGSLLGGINFSFAHVQRMLSLNGYHEGHQVKTSVSLSLLFSLAKFYLLNVIAVLNCSL